MKKYVIFITLIIVHLAVVDFSNGSNEKIVYPSHALVIETRLGQVGITGQRILRQLTEDFFRNDNVICIEKKRKVIIGHEKWEQLYVGFPAKEIDDLQGYYFIALGPLAAGKMCIKALTIEERADSYYLKVQGDSGPKVATWIYYSRNPIIREFSVARGKRKATKQLFDAAKFRNQFISSFSLGGLRGIKRTISINSAFRQEGKRMDMALQFFEKLEAHFRVKGEPSDIWHMEKVSSQMINALKNQIQSERSTDEEVIKLLIFFQCPELNLKIGDAANIRKDLKRRYTLKKGNQYFPGTFGVKVLITKK